MIKSILFAISFLSIIPIKNIEFTESEIKDSIKFFPVAGLLIGFILYFIALISIPIKIKALLILFFWEFLSGFFHLDGVADTADAIFSAKKDKSILFEIMKDSNIGTMGAVFIFFILFAKFILLEDLLLHYVKAIIIVPVIGRFSINFLAWRLNYAKDKGLGKFICESTTNNQFLISLLISFFIIILFFPKAIIPFVLSIFVLFIYSIYFNKKFNGVTGDLFGFSVETIELIFLLFLLI